MRHTGTSLMPTESMNFFSYLRFKWKEYNRTAKLKGKVKLDFNAWAYNAGYDLSGNKLIDVRFQQSR